MDDKEQLIRTRLGYNDTVFEALQICYGILAGHPVETQKTNAWGFFYGQGFRGNINNPSEVKDFYAEQSTVYRNLNDQLEEQLETLNEQLVR